jgi:hypothetical protein
VSDAVVTDSRRQDRRAVALLLACNLFLYAYFYQGDGWSMMAHFVTTRSIVEHRTFQISPFAMETGDVSVVNGITYSNKPPGIPIIGAAPYAVMAGVEKLVGLDLSAWRVVRFNQYLLTFLLCAVPAAMLVVMVYRWFRRDGATPRIALLLAGAFALGSLLWPYAGMMFNHLMAAALLFGAWMLIDSPTRSRRDVILASVMLGLAALVEYLAGPLVLLYLAYDFARRRKVSRIVVLCIGPVLGLLTLLAYQKINFGHALTPSYAYDNPIFVQQGLVVGKFHSPVWMRLYWLTYHRMRGLFVCCPLFLIPLLTLLTLLQSRRLAVRAQGVFCLAIVAYFTGFLLCYAYWIGGWGVGPRFFIPAMAFLFTFARPGFERWPKISAVFIAVSIVNMLAVTAVRALYPANDVGPPQHWDPIGVCLLDLVRGQLAQGIGSYNLGMLIGLRGYWSLLPPLIVILDGILIALIYFPPCDSAEARGFEVSASNASGSAALAHSRYMSPDGCSVSSATSER